MSVTRGGSTSATTAQRQSAVLVLLLLPTGRDQREEYPMQGPIRRLENPPVSSREAFAALDAAPHEPSAAERIAEHTGQDEYLLADKIADALSAGARGVQLTSAERLIVADVVKAHRAG